MPAKKQNTANTSASDKQAMDEDDAPELTAKELKRRTVTWRIGETVVSARQGRESMRSALTGKTRVNMHLDNDVIEYFKLRASGRGYQTLINSALREVMEGQALGNDIRSTVQQTIREEFARQTLTEFTGVSTSDQIEVRRWKD
jgi:uncharacterized protein (DUF4415 family)